MPADILSETLIRDGLTVRRIGRRLFCYSRVSSTQDIARAAARNHMEEGAVFFADEQTAGRGRLGRSWQAPPGSSLLLSVLLRPPLHICPLLSPIASLAVAEAVEDCTTLRPTLKWPNDLLLNGRKICGILAETEFLGTVPDFAVVGIGVNVNLDPACLTSLIYPATSLAAESGSPLPRHVLARSLLMRLDRWYSAALLGEPVLAAWRSRLETIGRRVRVSTGSGVEEGVAENVDGEGALILRRDDGSLVTLLAGDVTLQGRSLSQRSS